MFELVCHLQAFELLQKNPSHGVVPSLKLAERKSIHQTYQLVQQATFLALLVTYSYIQYLLTVEIVSPEKGRRS